MNLQENIQRIREMMGENNNHYISRDNLDQEYEEEYPKWRRVIFNYLKSEINYYAEINDGNIIVLFNNNDMDKNLIKYSKRDETLIYNSSLEYSLSDFIPDYILSRHFKYVIQDIFKKYFPGNNVRRIISANLI